MNPRSGQWVNSTHPLVVAVAAVLITAERPLRARQIAELLTHLGLPGTRQEVSRITREYPDIFAQNDAFEWTIRPEVLAMVAGATRRAVDVLPPLRPWQRDAMAAWHQAGRHGIVAAVTGAGKSRLGHEATLDHLKSDTAKVVIIVPTSDLATQWHNALRTVVPDHRIGQCGAGGRDTVLSADVCIYIINSAVGRLAADVARCRCPVLMVADECHRYGAETWGPSLQIDCDATLGLSATPEREYDYGVERFVIPALGPVVYERGHAAAVAGDDISDFSVAMVKLDLSDSERYRYEALTDEITSKRRALFQRYPELNGPARSFYPKLQAINRDLDEPDPLIQAFHGVVQARTHHLFRITARLDYMEWLLEDVRPDARMLVFCATIAESEHLANSLCEAGVAAAAHHSQINKTERGRRLDTFRSGELRALVAARTLDEGIDVPDADLAVIMNGSGVRRQRIQRMGRVLRKRPGKIARIVLLYAGDTREDPEARLGGDRFADEMNSIGRLERFDWPADGDDLETWLSGE